MARSRPRGLRFLGALADGRLDTRADSPFVAAAEGWKSLAAAVEKKLISAGDSNGSHAEVIANTAAALARGRGASGDRHGRPAGGAAPHLWGVNWPECPFPRS